MFLAWSCSDVSGNRRAEGPLVLPGQGNALVKRGHHVFRAGPTGQSFAGENGWPVGPDNRQFVPTFTRALPWPGRTTAPLGQFGGVSIGYKNGV